VILFDPGIPMHRGAISSSCGLENAGVIAYFSPDGIHWQAQAEPVIEPIVIAHWLVSNQDRVVSKFVSTDAPDRRV
jgi:hypothetical protein